MFKISKLLLLLLFLTSCDNIQNPNVKKSSSGICHEKGSQYYKQTKKFESFSSIEDCLKVSEVVNIPVVFDTHHYACYCQLHPEEKFLPASEYIPRILESWKRRGIKPKFHVSEQGSGRVGHHSDYIEVIPDHVIEIPEKYNMSIDLMVEAKMKEQAILRLYEKYGPNNFLKM